MIKKTGYTKKAILEIPELVRLSKQNKDVIFVAHKGLSYRDSCANYVDKIVYLGVIGGVTRVVSSALHELGHIRAPNKESVLIDEISAWKYAEKYAKDNGYKFSIYLKENALRNYRFSYNNCVKAFNLYCKEHHFEVVDKRTYNDIFRFMLAEEIKKQS